MCGAFKVMHAYRNTCPLCKANPDELGRAPNERTPLPPTQHASTRAAAFPTGASDQSADDFARRAAPPAGFRDRESQRPQRAARMAERRSWLCRCLHWSCAKPYSTGVDICSPCKIVFGRITLRFRPLAAARASKGKCHKQHCAFRDNQRLARHPRKSK